MGRDISIIVVMKAGDQELMVCLMHHGMPGINGILIMQSRFRWLLIRTMSKIFMKPELLTIQILPFLRPAMVTVPVFHLLTLAVLELRLIVNRIKIILDGIFL